MVKFNYHSMPFFMVKEHYCTNNPVKYNDPTGNIQEVVDDGKKKGGNTVLTVGAKGDEVKKLQEALNKAGYVVPVTGYFGAITQGELKKFQKDNGLVVDGKAGSKTFAYLYGTQSSSNTITATTTTSTTTTFSDINKQKSTDNIKAFAETVSGFFERVGNALSGEGFKTVAELKADGVDWASWEVELRVNIENRLSSIMTVEEQQKIIQEEIEKIKNKYRTLHNAANAPWTQPMKNALAPLYADEQSRLMKSIMAGINFGLVFAASDWASTFTYSEGGGNTVDSSKIIDSASTAKKGGETVAGHALQKHAGRNPDIWGKVSGNSTKINNTAMQHIDDIISGPGEFKTVQSNGISFLEKMLPDGRGIRLNMDGTFKGFIDQIR